MRNVCRVLESEKKNHNHGARANALMRTQIHTLARARACVSVVDERAHLLNFVHKRETDRQTETGTDRDRERETDT